MKKHTSNRPLTRNGVVRKRGKDGTEATAVMLSGPLALVILASAHCITPLCGATREATRSGTRINSPAGHGVAESSRYTMGRYPYSRFWAVYDQGELVCVTVYKKGALEVVRRLENR